MVVYYEVYVLSCLMKEPCHGYEIKKKLTDGFGFCTHVSNNTLYSILKKYVREGITSQSTEHIQGKPDRIVYTITDKGRRYFVQALRDFPDTRLMDRQQFLMRLYFFHLMDRYTRERLLRLRKKAVLEGLASLDNKAPPSDSPFERDAPAIGRHTRGMLQLDLDIIAHYEARLDEPCLLGEDGTVPDYPPETVPNK